MTGPNLVVIRRVLVSLVGVVVVVGCSATTASSDPLDEPLAPLVPAASAASAAEVGTVQPPSSAPTTSITTTTTSLAGVVTESSVAEPPAETVPPPEFSVLDRPLDSVRESSGVETARIQLRLIELGFWVSSFDGKYGHTTRQAVMAFQKYSGLKPTGSVDDQTAFALTIATARPVGRTTDQGVLVEIDKDRQLLFLMVDGRLTWALNISTGSGQYYVEQNQKDPSKWETGRSLTPSGRFAVNRERPEGWWQGDLGEIYRPKYFNGGIAIHGSPSIPNYPASHGCVRISTAAMDMIWDSGLMPIGTKVWVYGDDVPAANEPPAPAPPPTAPPVETIPGFVFTW